MSWDLTEAYQTPDIDTLLLHQFNQTHLDRIKTFFFEALPHRVTVFSGIGVVTILILCSPLFYFICRRPTIASKGFLRRTLQPSLKMVWPRWTSRYECQVVNHTQPRTKYTTYHNRTKQCRQLTVFHQFCRQHNTTSTSKSNSYDFRSQQPIGKPEFNN